LVASGLYENASLAYQEAAKPFLLFAGDVTVAGAVVTRTGIGNFIDDGFAVGQTVTFGDGTGTKFHVTAVAGDGSTMTLDANPANPTYTGVNKMLGTLTRTDGSSWLDSGFLEGQLFQLSGAGAPGGLVNKTFKIDLITGTNLNGTGSQFKLDV